MATMRMFVGHLLLLTIFMVVLLWSLYAQLRKQDFFRWWAWAWTSFAGYLAIGALSLQLAPAWTLLKGSLVLALLVCGFLQVPLLAFGACALRWQGKPSRVWVRAGIVVAVVASALIFAAALYCREKPPTSFVVRTLPRTLALAASLFFCTWVFVGQWRRNRSLAAVITGGFCSLYALDQTFYSLIYINQLVPGLAAQFPPLSFKLLLNPLSLFLDSVFEFGICLGIVLLLVEEHRRTALALLKSDEHADALAETNVALQAEITVRKQAEELLRNNEERFRLVWDSATDGMRLTDAEGTVVAVNEAFARLIGKPREEIEGYPMSAVYTASDQERILRKHLERFANRSVLAYVERQMTLWDGRKAWLEVSNCFLETDPIRPLLLGVFRDVTERKRAEKELAESEAKFRAVAEMASAAILVHDSSRFLLINRAAETMSGYNREELLAKNPFDLVHPEHRQMTRQLSDARRRGEDVPTCYECKILTKSGAERWFDFSATMLRFEGRDAVLVMAFDITERKRVEEALRESEDRYRDLVQFSNDLICTHDLKGNILSANPAGTRISGYSQDELLSMNLRDILAPQVRDQFENYLAEIQAKGIASGSMLVQTKSGEKRIWEYENSMRTRDNAAAIVRATASDVTERKQAERANLREKTFSEAMLDSLPGIFFLFDQTGRMLRWNRALEAAMGYSAEEIAAMRFLDFFTGKDRTLIEEAIGKVFEAGTASAEVAVVSKDGRRTLHYFVGVRFAMGGVPCCIGTGTDLTARKHLEEQLQESQKMEAVGRLAGGVAHDFNNILTAIQMNGSLLAGGLVPPDRLQEKARVIVASADRGATLTRQLLAFGRKQVLEPRILDLNGMLRGLSSLIRGIIPENISVTESLCDSLGLIKADPHQLEHVIINLVINARDAMPSGGRLIIETSNIDASGRSEAEAITRILPPGQYVMVAVSDTGIGMDPATQARIFEPFFTTRRNEGGTGLGLAMSYGTVKQSGGYIFVYSARDQGTTFKIFLPIVDAEPKAVATAAEPNSIRGRGETILLVEDEDLVRNATAEFLSAYGYVVLEARNGPEALRLAMSRPSDIAAVVTDMVMPGIDGREVVEILRQLRPNLKAVLMSGYTERKVVEKKEAVSFTFLQKPFTAEVLAKTLRRVLDENDVVDIMSPLNHR